MAEELGYTVLRLVRTAIGGVTLDGLVPGAVRMLTEQECRALLARPEPPVPGPAPGKQVSRRPRRSRRDDRRFPGAP
jgi:hypothetical protein